MRTLSARNARAQWSAIECRFAHICISQKVAPNLRPHFRACARACAARVLRESCSLAKVRLVASQPASKRQPLANGSPAACLVISGPIKRVYGI